MAYIEIQQGNGNGQAVNPDGHSVPADTPQQEGNSGGSSDTDLEDSETTV